LQSSSLPQSSTHFSREAYISRRVSCEEGPQAAREAEAMRIRVISFDRFMPLPLIQRKIADLLEGRFWPGPRPKFTGQIQPALLGVQNFFRQIQAQSETVGFRIKKGAAGLFQVLG
jgi:hypothetical protein